MIVDLSKFVKEGQVLWTELEMILDRFKRNPDLKLGTEEIQRFHYLYQRSSSDLAKLMGFSARQEVKIYLESLVGRAYSLIHETRSERQGFNFFFWLFCTFPTTFRKHIMAFWLAFTLIMTGLVFGAGAVNFDKDAKSALMPFSHLMQDPVERVNKEETIEKDNMAGHKSSFASYLVSNNTRVSFFTFSLGFAWGIGTIIVLFSNGVFLGAVIADYVLAGQTKFLIGWLLPHGSIEIPAIIIAGQAGFVVANAVIGWGKPISFKTRLRSVSNDLFTLLGGICLMLLWAGFIEAFFSQYHEPVISYNLKIMFGGIQLILLILYLLFSGNNNIQWMSRASDNG